MELYVLFYYNYKSDVYDYMATCDSIEACFTILRSNTDNFNTDKVFIGNRANHDYIIPYIIEEVTLNNY